MSINARIYPYFPRTLDDVVVEVDSFFYVLDTATPFALVFTTKDGTKRYRKYDELNALQNSGILSGTLVKDGNLCSLINEYKIGSSKYKTLRLTLGSGDNLHVEPKSQNIGTDIKFTKVIFVPSPSVLNGQDFQFCICNLFSFPAKKPLKNETGDFFPDTVNGQTFDSVLVYYTSSEDDPGDLAILIELVKDCTRTHIRRIAKDPPRWIEQEFNYNGDIKLIGLLNLTKEIINAEIIYELDKNSVSQVYSSRGVIVLEDSSSNFEHKIYMHKSLDYATKKALLLYCGKKIELVANHKIQNGPDKLIQLEEDIFTEIKTYALSRNVNEHLLIKLIKANKNYYLYRYSKDGTKWKQLGLQELKDAGINLSIVDRWDLSQQLEILFEDQPDSQSILNILLNHISLGVNSIIILLDKKLPYGKSEINPLITTEIPPIDIENNSIDVTIDDESSVKCLKLDGYRVCNHNITIATNSKKISDANKLYLRFYFDSNMIKLYDKAGDKHTPVEYHQGTNDLHVYYYGDDPRPLLSCYAGSAYIPSSKNYWKWVSRDEISKYLCEDTSDSQKLLAVLSEVIGFLNLVQLKKKTESVLAENKEPQSDGNHNYLYRLQKFNGYDISIKLTYRNEKCYRVYTHTANGTGDNGSNYRLGYIEHEGSNLIYDHVKPLSKVNVYYNVYDHSLDYPLLVVLEFDRNSDKEYYKLKDNNKNTKLWEKIQENSIDQDILKKLKDPKKIEDGLYELREDLKIEFDKSKMSLFKDAECKEGEINKALVAGTTVGTAAVVATVASVGVLVSKNIAATAAAAAAATAAAL
ncbi:hypothetical protein MACJ_002457 [Theileria orientalis]|uniref:Uncharacterized protein n=1 Tax=Theileria orientalis TaxID=68886 RepID=A0A976M686_THEOR|nr:hypothetical protein MACJ_002457 [Theileria orientalis]